VASESRWSVCREAGLGAMVVDPELAALDAMELRWRIREDRSRRLQWQGAWESGGQGLSGAMGGVKGAKAGWW